MKVAINGVGIAGPTLAYWLLKAGHDVLLIEQAPRLRGGGYAIDFWGVGYDIVEKMGLLPQIQALGFQINEVRFVDRHGATSGGFPVEVFRRMTGDRFIELRRSDLATAIYRALEDKVETIWGDTLTRIEQTAQRVRLDFAHAPACEANLLIGADGLHSRVRQLVFGAQANFEVPLGYHVAAFELEGYRPRDELAAVIHAAPGRQILRLSFRGNTTLFLFVFRDDYLRNRRPASEQECKTVLKEVFADVGWECPRILAGMEQVGSVYFDQVSQIHLAQWAQGRIALIGDAAACVSLLAGEGTGLAMAEAYALAGELAACGGDHVTAFARFQERMMPFLKRKQEAAAHFASSFVPRTAFGVTFRDRVSRLMRIPLVAEYFIGRTVRDDIVLPDYTF